MPLNERRARYNALYAKICEYDVHRWQQEFLTALRGRPGRESFHRAFGGELTAPWTTVDKLEKTQMARALKGNRSPSWSRLTQEIA
jgi:trehalose-6-phosphate synthase